MSNIFLFPGQGAQYPGMGKDLYENFSSVRELFALASDLASMDLKEILFYGTEEQLKKTTVTQIGITLINLSVATVLGEKGIKAEATAGFSLGEYSALWYSGVLSSEAVFRAVVERGRVMDNCCKKLENVGMAAVLGLSYEDVAAALQPLQEAGQKIYIANYNATRQIVIAGEGIAQVAEVMDKAGAMKYVELKVSGPFHSPLMRPAAEGFADFLKNQVEFAAPNCALYLNVTGKRASSGLVDLVLQQIYSPVLWVDIEAALKEDGFVGQSVEAGQPVKMSQPLEVGPGNVLTGLWKQFLRKEPCQALGTLEQIEDFVK